MRTSTQIQVPTKAGWGLQGKQKTTMNSETKSEYFSMNAVIHQNERQHDPIFRTREGGMPLGNEKAIVLAEPARLARCVTSIYVPRR